MHSNVSFASLRQKLLSGETTCGEITASCLSAIRAGNELNAFITVFEDEARSRAGSIDRKLAAGKAGPLAGMVVAVKDNICLAGSATTCASRMLEHFRPPYDATVLRRLLDADAIIVGKTNMDEFAMGSSTENSAFGPVRHPSDHSRVPGGSSGGSAVAVAAGMSTTALGSDTGGSVRQPAALCGIAGLKPSYGRVSRSGLIAFASSFDQIGIMGSCVADVASVLEVIAGHDPADATTSAAPVPEYGKGATRGIKGVRIGVPSEFISRSADPEVSQNVLARVEALRNLGAKVSEVTLPHSPYTIACYYVLTTAEASSNLARYDGVRYGRRTPPPAKIDELYARSRSEGFGPEVRRRVMLGTYVLSAGYHEAFYRKAQKVRRLIREDFEKIFSGVDCLITPTTPSTAFKLGEKMADPVTMYLADIFTVGANLAGIPALSVPCGSASNGLPVGVQVMGRSFDEEMVLRVGNAVELCSTR